MKITSVGIDLAKNVFQVHAVDERGKTGLRTQLRRDQMMSFFANGTMARPAWRRSTASITVCALYKASTPRRGF